jgi:hypothetical protein
MTPGCASIARMAAVLANAVRVFGGASEGSIFLKTMMAYQITMNDSTEKNPHRQNQTWRGELVRASQR